MYFTLCTEFICYDDACHFRRYSRNPSRILYTEQAKQLATVEIVVDKMHMKGHIDPWCLENCNPSKFECLHKVPHNVRCWIQVHAFIWFFSIFRLIQKCASKYFLGSHVTPVWHKKWTNTTSCSFYSISVIYTTFVKNRNCNVLVFFELIMISCIQHTQMC